MKEYNIAFEGLSKSGKLVTAKCMLTVSLLQDYNYGCMFESIVAEFDENFSNKCFMLADSILAYTYRALGHNKEEAEALAKNDKDIWLSTDIVKKEVLGGENAKEFYVWSEIIKSELFPSMKEFVGNLYANNKDFRYAVEIAASHAFTTYMKRYAHKITDSFEAVKGVEFCKQYILEECAGVLVIAREQAMDETLYLLFPKPNSIKSNVSLVVSCFSIMFDHFMPTKLKTAMIAVDRVKAQNHKSKLAMVKKVEKSDFSSSPKPKNLVDDYNFVLERLEKQTSLTLDTLKELEHLKEVLSKITKKTAA